MLRVYNRTRLQRIEENVRIAEFACPGQPVTVTLSQVDAASVVSCLVTRANQWLEVGQHEAADEYDRIADKVARAMVHGEER